MSGPIAFKSALIMLLGLLALRSAQAQTAAPPMIDRAQGQIQLRFQDGRVAQMQMQATDIFQFRANIQVITQSKNLDVERFKKANCFFVPAAQKIRTRMAWVQHPDSSKIHQTVIRRGQKMEYYETIYSISRFVEPAVTKDVLRDKLVCADFGWMTGEPTKAAPDKFIVYAWTADYPRQLAGFLTNKDTAYNVRLKRLDEYTMEVEHVESYSGPFNGMGLVGETIDLVLKDKKGGFHSVSLDVDRFGASAGVSRHDWQDTHTPFTAVTNADTPIVDRAFALWLSDYYRSEGPPVSDRFE